MGDGMPRDSQGLTPCAWCGGPIQQPATGRRREYCSRTHRELAYRNRKTQRAVNEAVKAERQALDVQARAKTYATARAPLDTSVVETRPTPETSVVETRPAAPAPRPARRRRAMTASAMPLLPSYDNDESGIA